MAKLEGFNGFTGSLAGISAYKRRDGDAIYIRSKGGPTRNQIRHGKQFDKVRQNNAEFGGRSLASGFIVRALEPLKPLSDYNLHSELNRLLKPIQDADTVREPGTRSIEISKMPQLLIGFSLNRRNLFESVVRGNINHSISIADLKATVALPQLLPGINFFGVDRYPVYRWQVLLTVVPDLFYHENSKTYKPNQSFNGHPPAVYTGEWHSVESRHTSAEIELQLQNNLPAALSYSLVLVAGIGFGTKRASGYEQVNYAGAGRVMGVVLGVLIKVISSLVSLL